MISSPRAVPMRFGSRRAARRHSCRRRVTSTDRLATGSDRSDVHPRVDVGVPTPVPVRSDTPVIGVGQRQRRATQRRRHARNLPVVEDRAHDRVVGVAAETRNLVRVVDRQIVRAPHAAVVARAHVEERVHRGIVLRRRREPDVLGSPRTCRRHRRAARPCTVGSPRSAARGSPRSRRTRDRRMSP